MRILKVTTCTKIFFIMEKLKNKKNEENLLKLEPKEKLQKISHL